MTLATRPADMADDPTITVSDRVSEEARATIVAGLEAASLELAGPFDPEPLAVLLRDGDGRLAGGLLGRTFWGWLVVETLWVAPGRRGTGLGRRLMAAAEAEARRRGCDHARVDTYSFQAPGFYEKCGYVRAGTLDDFPTGHQRHFYARRLDPASPEEDQSPA